MLLIAHLSELGAGHGRYRERHRLDVGVALCRRDDDFLELGTAPGACCAEAWFAAASVSATAIAT